MKTAIRLLSYFGAVTVVVGLCRLGRAETSSIQPAVYPANAATDYVEPEIMRSTGGELKLTLEAKYANNYIGKDPVYLRSFNGKLVGPTLWVKPGDKLKILLVNSLPTERWHADSMNTLHALNTINLHYHGLHVSPDGISDNVLITVGPYATQQYEVDIPRNHPPGTYWYHPHNHGSSAGTVASGMSGALIIQGGLDDIPQIKAAKDRVMVLNQIPYDNRESKVGTIEAKDGKIFGLGFPPDDDWYATKHYTTINGVQCSVIHMQPGQIERWRFVHSGQGEQIRLKFTPAPKPTSSDNLPQMREIAVDGLALGKMVDRPTVELWPGNRSDVLVQAPTSPGEYVLIDDSPFYASPPAGQMPLNTVARLVVDGAPVSQELPTNAQMAGLRLPSIRDDQITGQQVAKYGIQSVGGQFVYLIDGKPFDEQTARTLTLGAFDEWTIQSDNDPNPDHHVNTLVHPFHIHVNPFEVTSIMAPSKADPTKLVEQLTEGPVWRDTVQIPGGGYVKMRTHYEVFPGTFVQHCHILDHEDQGMMELINIVEPSASSAKSPSTTAIPSGSSRTPAAAGSTAPKVEGLPRLGVQAPDFTLPDAEGKDHSLRDIVQGKPTVVFFFKGYGCLHCSLQVAAFSEHFDEFAKRGIQVIGVSSDNVQALKAAESSSDVKFTILADPQGLAFAKYGCVNAQGLRHGTFSLDADGRVTWATVDATPFLSVRNLLPN